MARSDKLRNNHSQAFQLRFDVIMRRGWRSRVGISGQRGSDFASGEEQGRAKGSWVRERLFDDLPELNRIFFYMAKEKMDSECNFIAEVGGSTTKRNSQILLVPVAGNASRQEREIA